MDKEELKKEFYGKFNLPYVHDKGWALLREEVVNWWVNKINTYKTELFKRLEDVWRVKWQREAVAVYESSLIKHIEEMKIKHPVGSLADEHMTDKEKHQNKVINDIIKLIKNEINI